MEAYSLRIAHYKDIEKMQAILTKIYGANGYGAEIREYIDLVSSGATLVRVVERGSAFMGFITMYRDFELGEGFIAHCYLKNRKCYAINKQLIKLIKGFMRGLKIVVQLDRAEVKNSLKNHLSYIEKQEFYLKV